MDELKAILSDICESIEAVNSNYNGLRRRLENLEALVKNEPALRQRYEAALEKMAPGMGGSPCLKSGLKVRIQGLSL